MTSTIQVEGDEGDAGGVLVLLRSGPSVIAATGDGEWQSFDKGDLALLPAAHPPGCQSLCPHGDPEKLCGACVIVGGRYNLMHENWDMRVLPSGWQNPGFTPTADWSPAIKRTIGGFPRLTTKGIRAIALVPHVPKFLAVTASGVGSYKCADGAPGFCYVVDMEREIQGGINVTFKAGVAGHQVTVMASETLLPSGAVMANGSDTSLHCDLWTLTTGEQTVVSHEYIEARYWQVMHSPEAPSAELVAGWKTWYPMDSATDAAMDDDSQAGQTQIHTSSAALDTVWELCRYTGRIGAMDVVSSRRKPHHSFLRGVSLTDWLVLTEHRQQRKAA